MNRKPPARCYRSYVGELEWAIVQIRRHIVDDGLMPGEDSRLMLALSHAEAVARARHLHAPVPDRPSHRDGG